MGRLSWIAATVADVADETERARTLALTVPDWPGHRAGQHVDLRLTDDDGYQAVRSYSLAAPTDGNRLLVTVERIDGGEVSPYLVEEARPGDELEVRGPLGGYFTWEPGQGGPLLLIAGGSGVVPLVAMLRERTNATSPIPARLLYSVRSREDAIARAELDAAAADDPTLDVVYTFTRQPPPGWTGPARRIDRELLGEVAFAPDQRARTYVCGPTGFVGAVADALLALGHDPATIRTERFGASG